MKIAEFLSKKWTLGPYDFAISHVFGFGFEVFLLDRAYGTGPGTEHGERQFLASPSPLSLSKNRPFFLYSSNNYMKSTYKKKAYDII